MILGDNCHIYNYEGGGISALGGLAFHVLHNEPNGQLPLDQLQAAVRPDDAHCSRSGLVCLESSHNRCGGTVLSLEYMAAVKHWADGHGMPVHLDGARVFNAAQALGVEVGTIAAHVTSVQFCLSKVNISMNHISHQSHCHITQRHCDSWLSEAACCPCSHDTGSHSKPGTQKHHDKQQQGVTVLRCCIMLTNS